MVYQVWSWNWLGGGAGIYIAECFQIQLSNAYERKFCRMEFPQILINAIRNAFPRSPNSEFSSIPPPLQISKAKQLQNLAQRRKNKKN